MYIITWNEQRKCMVVNDIDDVKKAVEDLVSASEAFYDTIIVHHSVSSYRPVATVEFEEVMR